MTSFIITHLFHFWLAMTLLFLVMELFSGGFFIICFSLGALVSMIAVLFGISFYGQLAIFAVFSILSLLVIRPVAVKYFYRKSEQKVSNADAIIGRVGEVSETIELNGFGRVKLDGDDWKAQSQDAMRIEKGTRVRILSRDSIIVTVEKVA
ncbi:MAG: NfeD family protein [Paludibacteraceae bacterium]|nr:NfeD family protein [Paludibacteraceae bacterium]